MIIISHRGNLEGPTDQENKPEYIDAAHEALKNKRGIPGLVEVDLWEVNSKLYLGHDSPLYEYDISKDKYRYRKVYHLKNMGAITGLISTGTYYIDRFFAHNNDPYVVTSHGELWCFPGVYYIKGITVELGRKKEIPEVAGICTDYPLDWIK